MRDLSWRDLHERFIVLKECLGKEAERERERDFQRNTSQKAQMISIISSIYVLVAPGRYGQYKSQNENRSCNGTDDDVGTDDACEGKKRQAMFTAAMNFQYIYVLIH